MTIFKLVKNRENRKSERNRKTPEKMIQMKNKKKNSTEKQKQSQSKLVTISGKRSLLVE